MIFQSCGDTDSFAAITNSNNNNNNNNNFHACRFVLVGTKKIIIILYAGSEVVACVEQFSVAVWWTLSELLDAKSHIRGRVRRWPGLYTWPYVGQTERIPRILLPSVKCTVCYHPTFCLAKIGFFDLTKIFGTFVSIMSSKISNLYV